MEDNTEQIINRDITITQYKVFQVTSNILLVSEYIH